MLGSTRAGLQYTGILALLVSLQVRVSSSEMADFAAFENTLNERFGSTIKTEFPFNALGILDEVSA